MQVHYHVFSGPRGEKMPSTMLKFTDRMEGISSFISMAKIIWVHQEFPPEHEQITINPRVSMIRMQDRYHRLAFVYCSNNCDDDDNLEFKLEL